MYLGHFAVGLAARPLAPKASLGAMLAATQVVDILYGIFACVGLTAVGTAGPMDHGLVMTLVWSTLAGAAAFAVWRDLRSGVVIGLLVLSHWVGDFVSHFRVLPLAFSGSPLVGLGLYRSPVVMIAMDFGLFAAGIFIYLRTTKPADRAGTWGFWLLIAWILAGMAACVLPGKLIVIASAVMLGTLPLGIWVDRHRIGRRAVVTGVPTPKAT